MTTVPANVNYPLPGDRTAVVPVWNRVGWGPIMMGVFSAIGVQLIFTMLGIAIGISSADASDAAARPGEAIAAVTLASGIWWLISGTLALFIGGMVFGRLSGLPRAVPLYLEGIVLWSVVALFGFFVVWSGAGMATHAATPIAALATRFVDPTDAARLADGALATDRGLFSPRGDDDGNVPTPAGAASPSGAPAETTRDGALGTEPARDPVEGARSSTSDPSEMTVAAADDASDAAQAASWWSVVGLLVGMAATVLGAAAGVTDMRIRHPNP